MESSVKKQIRNLLLVVFSGVAVAFLFTGYMLYTYNPTGEYSVKNVLIAPETIEDLRSSGNVISDSIEYEYSGKRVKISKSDYARFYTAILNDSSTTQNLSELFTNSSRLILSLQSDSNTILQEVQFIENYYRIQLREQSAESVWAYFSHDKIQEEINRILGISRG